MAAPQHAFTPRKKTLLDEFLSKLYTLNPSGGRPSALTIIPRAKNIGIEVYTNQPGDDKPISVNLLPIQFFSLFGAIRNLTTAPSGTTQEMIVKSNFRGREKVDVPYPVAKIQFGRDNEGVIFIRILAKGRANIKFSIQLDELSEFSNPDNSAMDPGVASAMATVGYVDFVTKYAAEVMATKFNELDEKPSPAAGGNGGGWDRPAAAPARQAPAVAPGDFDDAVYF